MSGPAELLTTATHPFRGPGPGTRLTPLLYAARLLSQAGQALFFAGLFWAVGTQESAALGASGLMAAMMAASMLCGLPGGAIADRMGPGRAAVAGAAGRGGAVALALTLAWAGGGRVEFAVLAAFLYSAVSQLYSPAELALVRLVSPKRPSGTHAALIVLQYGGQGAGLAVGAALLMLGQGPLALLIAGAAAFAGVAALGLVISLHLPDQASHETVLHSFAFGDAFRFFARQPGAGTAGVFLAFSEMTGKALAVAVPFYLADTLGLDHLQMAVLAVPAGLGVLAGLYWAGRSCHPRLAPRILRFALLGSTVALVAMAVLGSGLAEVSSWISQTWIMQPRDATTISIAVAVPAAVLLGLCLAAGPVAARALLTSTAPTHQQSRVFAMQGVFADGITFIPLLLLGAGTDVVGAQPSFLALGIAGAAALLLLEGPRLRRRSWTVAVAEGAAS